MDTMSSSQPDLAELLSALPARSQQLLALASQQWDRRQGLLVFAYGSLIWKPGFSALEYWPAAVHGYHRALRLRSLVNRGSRAQPGLVLTLLSGGSCRGLLYRVAPAQSQQVLEALWAREMVVGSYDPRWLDCRTPAGRLKGLSFTLSRRSPGYAGAIADAELLHILRHAQGRYGSTLDYLARSVAGLREHGIHDHELERQLALALAHGLLPASPQEAPVD
jgi:cation transport protein ChaC